MSKDGRHRGDAFTASGTDGRTGFIDNLTISTNVPTDLSLDGDALSDWWELNSFGNRAQTPEGGADQDGLTNL